MNVPSQKDLLLRFDQQQRDHPIGGIVLKFVDGALKKSAVNQDKKIKRKTSKKHHRSTRSSLPQEQPA